MPEWQRIAGKAAKEVEKFAKEKTDIVLMHWRDKMGIAQKEVRIYLSCKDTEGPIALLSITQAAAAAAVCSGVSNYRIPLLMLQPARKTQ